MIRHCVFIRFKPSIAETERAAILSDIVALQPLIPGYIRANGGANASPEGLGKGYNSGFVIDFADASARDVYLEHPEHAKVGSRIVAASEGGTAGIFVYDFEMAD